MRRRRRQECCGRACVGQTAGSSALVAAARADLHIARQRAGDSIAISDESGRVALQLVKIGDLLRRGVGRVVIAHLLRRAIDGQLDPRLRRQGSFVLYRHARWQPARHPGAGRRRRHSGSRASAPRYARSDSGRAEPAAAAGRHPRAGRRTAASPCGSHSTRRRYRECTAHSPARVRPSCGTSECSGRWPR